MSCPLPRIALPAVLLILLLLAECAATRIAQDLGSSLSTSQSSLEVLQ